MNTFTKSALLGATMFTMVGAANAESHASSAMSFGLDANASIAENAMKVPTFSTLVAAVQAAGLADELMGDGDFTIDEKAKQLYLTEHGQVHIEDILKEKGLLAEDPGRVAQVVKEWINADE